jgi:hypothetical protein
MTQTGNELNDDLWFLHSDEMSLLPGSVRALQIADHHSGCH